MSEENIVENKTEVKMALKEEAPKKNILKLGAPFLPVVLIIVLGFVCLNLHRALINQGAFLESIEKDVLVGKDQISSLTSQYSLLNNAIKENKKQMETLDTTVSSFSEVSASIKKSYEAQESKITDLNQEIDDKFGRLSKEVGEMKNLVGPVKEDVLAMKESSKKWQADHETAMKDLQDHVNRAAGLIAQMRDEMNKKVDFLSMVQEKMIKDIAANNAVPAAIKKLEDSTEKVVHHQILNSSLPEATDKSSYQSTVK